jgi:hypothetical protein
MTDSQWLEAQKAYDRVRALLVNDGLTMDQAQKTLETLVMFVIGSKLSKEEANVHLAKFIEAMLKGDKPQC